MFIFAQGSTIECNKKVNYYGAIIINHEELRHNRPG
jgi:hypothetical protein